jgi:hypothetical protein
MDHTKHLWRLGFLLVLLFAVVIVGRHFLVPDSFGQMGHYRYDALFEFYDKEPVHGGQGACAECHDDAADDKAGGAHAGVQCEVCHDVIASHIRDDDKFADMKVNRSVGLCTLCHLAQPARPAGHPQIVLAEHLELEPGQRPSEDACLECHEAHNP